MATVQWFQAIHLKKRFRLGTQKKDIAGNTYIYLGGVASTVAGSAVSYNNLYQSALTVTGVRGPVAFAQAVTVALTFGWYLVEGTGSANFNGAAVAGAKLYSASTGLVDDAVVAGDQITNAVVGATVAGAGLGTILVAAKPFMNGLG